MSSKRNWDLWNKPAINRLAGFIAVLAGLVTFIAGFGAWKNPHLDWSGFVDSITFIWVWLFEESIRLINDPFAFLGLLLMLAGILVTLNGLANLIPEQ
ncbi:MAG: hypothetical protein JSV76_00330 [Candidatus Bathyarchaeota archaeon]|jgi:hypothetical protein|nr:MAG: hypothetical protein JSV76_00330 [Candidatus Bathyarchaeota archaeon]